MLARVASSRSIVAGFGLVAAAALLYLGARETSLFAVRTIEVKGASPALAAEVRAVLAPLEGASLLGLDGAEIERRVDALPAVLHARYDRGFPHTLTLFVRPERPVAVLRQGAEAWVVSARARVIAPINGRQRPRLPRIWLPRAVDVTVGATLAAADGGTAVAAVAPLARAGFPGRVRFVRFGDEELTLVLRSGLELRLGDTVDLPLKLAVAREIIPLAASPGYVDVSVPERPVAAAKSQVGG